MVNRSDEFNRLVTNYGINAALANMGKRGGFTRADIRNTWGRRIQGLNNQALLRPVLISMVNEFYRSPKNNRVPGLTNNSGTNKVNNISGSSSGNTGTNSGNTGTNSGSNKPNNGTNFVPPPPPVTNLDPPKPTAGQRPVSKRGPNNRGGRSNPKRGKTNNAERLAERRRNLANKLREMEESLEKQAENLRQAKEKGKIKIRNLQEYNEKVRELLKVGENIMNVGTTELKSPFPGGNGRLVQTTDPFATPGSFRVNRVRELESRYKELFNNLQAIRQRVPNFQTQPYISQNKSARLQEDINMRKTLNYEFQRKIRELVQKLSEVQQLKQILFAATNSSLQTGRGAYGEFKDYLNNASSSLPPNTEMKNARNR